jgi:hypothetical protein
MTRPVANGMRSGTPSPLPTRRWRSGLTYARTPRTVVVASR